MKERYYYKNPEVWEFITKKRIDKEIKFLTKLFKKYGTVKSVLDVGCASGLHTKALSDLGFEVYGIDYSKSFVEYSKKKHPSLKFEQQDMKNLKINKKFDAIICLATTIAYNDSNEDVINTLKGFYKVLKKNGILIIETFNTIGFISNWKEKDELKVEDQNIIIKINHGINYNKQKMIDMREYRNLQTNKLLGKDTQELRMFFPQEMKFYLETSGFEFLDFYGLYDAKHKDLDRHKLITVSKKK